MRRRYGEQSFAAHSRYTHVYLKGASGWQLVDGARHTHCTGQRRRTQRGR